MVSPSKRLPFPTDAFTNLQDLTIRDVFAPAVLSGLAGRPDWSKWTDEEAADEAFSAAEAMLTRRGQEFHEKGL